jgi:hypothetical protein
MTSDRYDMLDNTGSNDSSGFDAESNRIAEEHQIVHGFVTVIKNEGREDEQVLCKNAHNILTNLGRDKMHVALYTNAGVASQLAFKYIGLSENAGGFDAAHTELLGEITGGGLERSVASLQDHSGGSNQSTIANTFVATATHTDVRLSGLFDEAGPPVAGVMGHENSFTPASLESADTLTVTWTLTLG